MATRTRWRLREAVRRCRMPPEAVDDSRDSTIRAATHRTGLRRRALRGDPPADLV
jgi:hypothetical protein